MSSRCYSPRIPCSSIMIRISTTRRYPTRYVAEIAAEESIRTAAERKKAEDEAYQAEREREAKERMDKDYNLSGGHVIKEAYHGFGKDREKGE